MKYKDWTFEEDKYILTSDETNEEIAEKLNRTLQAITRRKRMLEKTKTTVEVLEYQEEFIIGTYSHLSIEKISEYLKEPYSAIKSRLKTLRKQGNLRVINYEYSDLEEQFLIMFKDKLTLKELAENLDCTVAKIAVKLEDLRKQIPSDSKPKIDKMPRVMKIPTPQINSLLLEDIKKDSGLIVGKLYEINIPGAGKGDSGTKFKGKFIEETEFHLIFQAKSGYRESFTKVNFKIKEYEIREVIQ